MSTVEGAVGNLAERIRHLETLEIDAANLPNPSNIWTRVAPSVYTTNANDNVIPHAGTGSIGLTADRWDNGFFENLAVTTGITMSDDGWIGIGAALERIIFDAAGDITVRGANLEIWDAGDILVYDGAPGNLLFGVDGATGNYLTQGRAQFVDANTFITRGGATFTIQTDRNLIQFAPGGAVEIVMGQALFYPADTNTTPCGAATKRWKNVWSVLGDFDQANNAAAVPVVTIDQADISEGFINFIGSDRGVIAAATASLKSVRVELGGVVYRLALYVDA